MNLLFPFKKKYWGECRGVSYMWQIFPYYAEMFWKKK
jgi:hypothetical protein